MGAQQVIFNADDFGASPSINAAILLAYQQGVLTSASLMVNGPAAPEALQIARANPGLAVGLHVTLSDGCPILPPGQIPNLVGRDGRFINAPLALGLRLTFKRQAQLELEREMHAQFELFQQGGLPLDHVNTHMHLHIHPVIFPRLITLAVEFHAGGLRLPHDDLRLAIAYQRKHVLLSAFLALIFGVAWRSYNTRILATGLNTTERVFGLYRSGAMEEGYLLKLLQGLRVTTSEIYFHPDLAKQSLPMGPNPDDLAALLSQPVCHQIEASNLQLATYRTLHRYA